MREVRQRCDSWCFQPSVPNAGEYSANVVIPSGAVRVPQVADMGRMGVVLADACHADKRPAGSRMGADVEDAWTALQWPRERPSIGRCHLDGWGLRVPSVEFHNEQQRFLSGMPEHNFEKWECSRKNLPTTTFEDAR